MRAGWVLTLEAEQKTPKRKGTQAGPVRLALCLREKSKELSQCRSSERR